MMKMTTIKLYLLIALTASSCYQSKAFSPLSFHHHRSMSSPKTYNFRNTSLKLSRKRADKNENDKLSLRTDINQFLTQRTIQTFLHLLNQMRDPHTGAWIELFLDSKNLLAYHGTGGICMATFPKWDTALSELIEQPPDVVIVEIQAGNASRGLSKNNPYREREVSYW